MTAKPPAVEISNWGSVSVTDTAKLVRYWLKREFPGTRFSVRASRYAGGASVNVDWTDGPLVPAVEAVLRPFEGAGFDGMQDLKTHNESWLLPDGSAMRHVSGIGQWGGASVRDGSGVTLLPEQVNDYMAGLKTGLGGETTRRGYDTHSFAYKLGQADAAAMTKAGAKLVSFGADYIHTHRTLSPELRQQLIRAVLVLSGRPGPFTDNEKYSFCLADRGYEDWGNTLVYQLSRIDPGVIAAAVKTITEKETR